MNNNYYHGQSDMLDRDLTALARKAGDPGYGDEITRRRDLLRIIV